VLRALLIVIAADEAIANFSTKADVIGSEKLATHSPLIALTKAQIIQKRLELNMDYGITFSCYDPLPYGTASESPAVQRV